MGYIYLIENKINNKKYVGQTKKDDIKTRWNQHKKIDKRSIGTCLYNAYNKYGIENFIFKIICICFDSDTDKYEIDYIKKYNTISPNGYNLQEGGNNRKHNEFTINILKEKLKIINAKNIGKKLSLETRNKISENLKGIKNPNYNKKMSTEQKEKIRNTMLSFSTEKRKEINEKILNTNKLKNIVNTKKTTKSSKLSKKIAQYNLDGSIVKIFDSISHASKELNVDRMNISRCCSDKYIHYKTCKGFIWKFYNEE
jgi:group I intron endonuclease